MTLKTLLVAAAIFGGSGFSALAACSGHSDQAMTCTDGTAYDAETGTCKVVTG